MISFIKCLMFVRFNYRLHNATQVFRLCTIHDLTLRHTEVVLKYYNHLVERNDKRALKQCGKIDRRV